MLKYKTLMVFLAAVMIFSTAELFAQGPGGAGNAAAGEGRAGQRGNQQGAPDMAARGGFGGGRAARTYEPPFPIVPPTGIAAEEDVDALIATLQSPDSSLHDKSEALRRLSICATAENVPFLASLLDDENLAHMARYAMEPLDDPSVDEAFRAALGRLEGSHLVGVIMSIGERRDTQAVDALAGMLSNSDNEVVQTTAISLGKIGNAAAITALRGALASVSEDNQRALTDGLFRAAESLQPNQSALAVEIYDQILRMNQLKVAIRMAALRGAILSRGNDGAQLLSQYLSNDDSDLLIAAVRTSLEMTAPGTTEALTGSLDRLSSANQVIVIGIIGLRGDVAAVPALLRKAQSGDINVRLAAIKVLPQVPSPSSTSVLIGLMRDSNSDIAKAANTSITSMPGQAVDTAIVALLNSSNVDERLAAIEIVGNREITSSVPVLIELASENNPRIRQAALMQIGELGTLDNLNALLEIAMNLSGNELDVAIEAIGGLFSDENQDKQAYAQQIISRITNAQPVQKGALLRILSFIGGDAALSTVRSALSDTNQDIRIAAIESLSDWPDFSAAQILYDIAANSNASVQDNVLSLRGVADLVRERAETDHNKRTSLCLSAYNIARRDEERIYLISAMGYLRNIEIGNKLVQIATDNQALREEAAAALIKVATSLYTGEISSAAVERAQAEQVQEIRSAISLSSGRADVPQAERVTATEEEMAAAQAMGQSILDLNISETVNASAQNIASGNLGRRGRGGFGGAAGGQRGGAAGGQRGQRGG